MHIVLALAADRLGRLYAVYYHTNASIRDRCPGCNQHLLVQVSEDHGASWTVPAPIAPIAVRNGQFDPRLAVDPADGRTIDATFMQNDPGVIMFVQSRNGGATWSAPRAISGPNPRGYDKDVLVARGDTMAVAYDDFLNTWVSVSRDGGRRLYFACGSQSPQTAAARGRTSTSMNAAHHRVALHTAPAHSWPRRSPSAQAATMRCTFFGTPQWN